MSSGRHAGQRSRGIAPRKAPAAEQLDPRPAAGANRHRAPSRNPALAPAALGMAAVAVAAATGGIGAASPTGATSASGPGFGDGPLAALGLPEALAPMPLLSAESIGDTSAGSATATRAATARVTVPTAAPAAAAPVVGPATAAPAVAKPPAAKAEASKSAPAKPATPAVGPLATVVGALPELDSLIPGVLPDVAADAVVAAAVTAADSALDSAVDTATDPGINAAVTAVDSAVAAATPEPAPSAAADEAVAAASGTTATGTPATGTPAAAVADAVQTVETAVAGALVDGSEMIAAEVMAARARARELLAQRSEEIAAAAQKAAATQISDALTTPRSCAYSARIQKQPKLSSAQLRNVRAIVDVAKELNLPPRAAVIALATAQQESWLKNLNWGDRDSLGLFQQRPSMGWGSPSQVTDPKHAARSFYNALKDVDGWEHLPVTVAAQRVQRSAFGSRYAQWELMAAKLVASTLDAPVTALDCTPR